MFFGRIEQEVWLESHASCFFLLLRQKLRY